jgi:hypothetical protein
MELKYIPVLMTPFRQQREQVQQNPGRMYRMRFTGSPES